MSHLVFRPAKVTGPLLERMVRKAWLEFYAVKVLVKRLGFSLGKVRFFIWLVNLALCFYTRKRLRWTWKKNQ